MRTHKEVVLIGSCRLRFRVNACDTLSAVCAVVPQTLDLELLHITLSPLSSNSFVQLDLTMKKYLKALLPRKGNQPQLPDTGDEGSGDVPTVPNTSSSSSACPIGCETLFEGAVPIVAE